MDTTQIVVFNLNFSSIIEENIVYPIAMWLTMFCRESPLRANCLEWFLLHNIIDALIVLIFRINITILLVCWFLRIEGTILCTIGRWLISFAAHAGLPEANTELGLLYERGNPITPPDQATAYEYYDKAADLGDADAMLRIATLIDSGVKFEELRKTRIPNTNTEENEQCEFPVDNDAVERMIHKAASLGNAKAMFKLILPYCSITKYSQCVDIVQRMKKLGELGHEEAFCRYALMCKAHHITNEEKIVMFTAISKRASKQRPMAMVTQCFMLHFGIGCTSDPDAARQAFTRLMNIEIPYTDTKGRIYFEAVQFLASVMQDLPVELRSTIDFVSMQHIRELLLGAAIKLDLVHAWLALEEFVTSKEEKIDCLQTAADKGLLSAWQRLAQDCYMDDPYLLDTWPREKLLILRNLNESIHHKDDSIHKYAVYDHRCPLCLEYSLSSKHDDKVEELSPTEGNQEVLALDKRTRCFYHFPENWFVVDKVNKLGEGGQGAVYRAIFRVEGTSASDVDSLPKNVALKVLSKESSMSNLADEIYYLKVLQGSGQYITRCYGHTMLGTQLCMVTELANYGDLESILTLAHFDLPKLPFQLLLQWMLDIAIGIKELHKFGIAHCDIKPANALVFETLKLKLSDVGLSRKTKNNVPISHPKDGMSSEDSSITNTFRVGTAGYMDPEIILANGVGVTLASDIFSFGMTCTHIINQRKPNARWRPFVNEAITKIESSNSLSEVGKNILVNMMNNCCRAEASKRQSIHNCIEDLTNVISNGLINDNEVSLLTIEHYLQGRSANSTLSEQDAQSSLPIQTGVI